VIDAAKAQVTRAATKLAKEVALALQIIAPKKRSDEQMNAGRFPK